MKRKRLPLKINAVDFTEYAHRTAYTVVYEDRIGPNSGLLLDGTETGSLLARKAVITWPLNDLTGDKLAKLLTLCEDEFVAVEFWDPKRNSVRSGVFRPNVSAATCNNITAAGVYWFTGQVLTLRER